MNLAPLMTVCRMASSYRRYFGLSIVLGLLLFANETSFAQLAAVNGISTVAGNGTSGNSGDGGSATSAMLSDPTDVAHDQAGNLYISDGGTNTIRKVSPNGIITTVAGNGGHGYSGDGGPATSAELYYPQGIVVDSSGNLYIADAGNSVVRVVRASTGIITTFAGTGTLGYSGDGGPATSAKLGTPKALALDAQNNLFISDVAESTVRLVTNKGLIFTVAGTGVYGESGDGGLATSAKLEGPAGVALDSAGNLYIAENIGNRIREVTAATGIITTVVGTGASGYSGDGGLAASATFRQPAALAFDSVGRLYITDAGNNVVRMVYAGIITTVAGNGSQGYSGDGGPAIQARMQPAVTIGGGIRLDAAGNLYIADGLNYVVRKVSPLSIPATSVGSSSAPQKLFLQTTANEAISSFTAPASLGGKQEYVIGAVTGCTVDGATSNAAGSICSVPITFSPAYPGPRPVPLLAATSGGKLTFGMNGLATAPLATLTPGIISTLVTDFAARVGPSMAMDNVGDIFVPDYSLCVVYEITPALVISTVAGMSGQCGFSGDGGAATSAQIFDPLGIALDSAGNLYIASGGTGGNALRKVSIASGTISTVAGNGTYGYSGDGGLAVNAEIGSLAAVAVDAAGNLYLCEVANRVIRKVNANTGIIATIAGNGATGYNGDNQPATSANISPSDVSTDATGNVYIADSERLRRVDATTGIITTIAGNGSSGLPTDGVAATSSTIYGESAPIFDAAGDFFFESGSTIRKVTVSTGLISTVAGIYSASFVPSSGDGGLATQANINPSSFALDPTGNLLIVGADYTGSSLRRVDTSTTSLIYPTSTAVGSLDTADDPQAAILNNLGNEPLTGSSGNGAITSSWLMDVSSTCFPLTSLASGSSCTLPVDFKPTLSGALTGTLTLEDNSLNTQPATQTIALSGTATGGSLSISPTTQTFTATAVGSISSSATSTITNTTSSVAYLSTGSLTDANDFTQSDNCNGTVANGGGTCVVTFTFTPKTTGTLTSTYTITGADYTNHPLGTLTVGLSGAGNPAPGPQAVLNPASLSFTTVVNTAANNQVVTLTNPGTANLIIDSFQITGTNATSFTIVSNTCGPTRPDHANLAAGASCQITIGFPVVVAGTYTASLTVTDDASPTTQSVPLTGQVNGVPQAALSPATLTFTSAAGTISAVQTATLSNQGTAPLTISSVAITGSNASSFSQTNTCGALLAAGSSCTIGVTFTPMTAGSYTASLVVTDNSGATVFPSVRSGVRPQDTPAFSTQTTALTGAGKTAAAPLASLTPANLTFSASTGSTTSTQTATLSNTGNAALAITSASLTGSNSSLFALASNTCGSSLAAGANCTIGIIFHPTAAGSSTASLTVVDAVGTQTSTLTGTATAPPTPADFTISATPAAQSSYRGQNVSYKVQVASLLASNPFTSAVTLFVTGLPAGATASFSPETLIPGTTQASSTLTVTIPPLTGTAIPIPRPGNRNRGFGISLACLLAGAALFHRKRRTPRLLAVLLFCGLSGLALFATGCGTGTGFAVPSPTSTLTITGTSGTTTHSTNVTLTIQ